MASADRRVVVIQTDDLTHVVTAEDDGFTWPQIYQLPSNDHRRCADPMNLVAHLSHPAQASSEA